MNRLLRALFVSVALLQCVALYDPCEIDLVDINPDIAEQLDPNCRTLVGDERVKAKAEAEQFARFVKKLHDFEANMDPTYVEPAEGEDPVEGLPEIQWGIRFDIYNQTEPWLCANGTVYESYSDYLDCSFENRRQMQGLLDGYRPDDLGN